MFTCVSHVTFTRVLTMTIFTGGAICASVSDAVIRDDVTVVAFPTYVTKS